MSGFNQWPDRHTTNTSETNKQDINIKSKQKKCVARYQSINTSNQIRTEFLSLGSKLYSTTNTIKLMAVAMTPKNYKDSNVTVTKDTN